MGAAQSIPVVGEIVTVIDSAVKITTAGVVAAVGEILDDDEARDAAKKFASDAGNTWVEYSERNLIAGPVRATIHSAGGDEEEADRVINKTLKSTEQCIDSTPIVGHVKGVVHYATGDIKHGDDCMKGASRTAAVFGAGLVTGGAGAGVVAGGFAAAGAGVVYDETVTLIEDKPYGIIASVDKAIKADEKQDGYNVVNSSIDVGYSLVGDFMTGVSAAQTAESVNKSQTQRNNLREKVGNKKTKNVVDTAKQLEKNMKTAKGDGHVCTKAKDMQSGKSDYGMNKRYRTQDRINNFEKNGPSSGYTSKTNATKGRVGEFPREPGILEKTAADRNMPIRREVPNRTVRACAEHEAFNKLGKTGFETNVETYSVTSNKGKITAIERCGNCKQFGEMMGDVVTDSIHGETIPTRQFTLDSSAVGHSALKSAPIILGQAAKHSKMSKSKYY